MTSFLQDVRFALRNLRRNPTFTFVGLFALMLGVGATSAIFSVVRGVLLDSLPYEDPAELMVLSGTLGQGAESNRSPVSYQDFLDWRNQNADFEVLAAHSNRRSFNLSVEGAAEQVEGEFVTPGYFRMLGMQPVVGRGFGAGEEVLPPTGRVVVLGFGVWQQRFASDPAILEREITLNDEVYRIIGVAPAGFRGLTDHARIWLPLTAAYSALGPRYVENRGFRWLSVAGRLAEGVGPEQGQLGMDAVAAQLARRYPSSNDGFGVLVRPLREEWFGDLRAPLMILLGVAAGVLLIACTNVAGLLLARAASRRHEVSVRSALGARRGRLIRQFLTESLVLALFGGLLGLLFAFGATRVFLSVSAVELRSFVRIGIDPWVVGVALLVAVAAALLFGGLGAMVLSRSDPGAVLRGTIRESTGRPQRRLLGSLVSGQLALTLILFITTGWMVEGFRGLRTTELGFRSDHLLTARVDLKGRRYAEDTAVWNLASELLDRLGALPGVTGVALTGPGIPTDTWYGTLGFPEEAPEAVRSERLILLTHFVSPGYFSTLETPLVEGSDFAGREGLSGGREIIVSRSLAERLWPGQSAIGKRIKVGRSGPEAPWWRTIGVAADIDHRGVAGEPRPGYEVYLPLFSQPPRSPPTLNMLLRTETEGGLIAGLRRELAAIAPTLPPFDISWMDERLNDQVSAERFGIFLVSLFAGLAMTLAAIGVYGVVSYSVSRREREIGIRLAIGARSGQILWMVLRQALSLTTIGLVIGVAVGLVFVPPVLGNLLYSIRPSDPLILFLACLVLVLAGVVASWIPAVRATRIPPASAMRSD